MFYKEKRDKKKLQKAYNAASGVIAGLTALRDAEGSQFQFTVSESEYDTSVHIRTNVPENPENFDTLDIPDIGNVGITVDRLGQIAVYDGVKYSPGYVFGPSMGVDMPHAAVMGSGKTVTDEAITYIKTRAKVKHLLP